MSNRHELSQIPALTWFLICDCIPVTYSMSPTVASWLFLNLQTNGSQVLAELWTEVCAHYMDFTCSQLSWAFLEIIGLPVNQLGFSALRFGELLLIVNVTMAVLRIQWLLGYLIYIFLEPPILQSPPTLHFIQSITDSHDLVFISLHYGRVWYLAQKNLHIFFLFSE